MALSRPPPARSRRPPLDPVGLACVGVGTAVVLAIYFATFAARSPAAGVAAAAKQAASGGLLVSAGVIAVALAVASWDAGRRRRPQKLSTGEEK